MNYITTKYDNIYEYRIYFNGDYDGMVIYKGDKRGVETELLFDIIDYRIDRSTNKVFVLRYDKIKSKISRLDDSLWQKITPSLLPMYLRETWDSLVSSLPRKIIISKVLK